MHHYCHCPVVRPRSASNQTAFRGDSSEGGGGCHNVLLALVARVLLVLSQGVQKHLLDLAHHVVVELQVLRFGLQSGLQSGSQGFHLLHLSGQPAAHTTHVTLTLSPQHSVRDS